MPGAGGSTVDTCKNLFTCGKGDEVAETVQQLLRELRDNDEIADRVAVKWGAQTWTWREHLDEAARQAAALIGIADPDRTGITGGSYGGYASAWAATALSEEYAAAVMFVGISNQISKFGTTDIPMEMYNVHARKWPWEDWQGMLEVSPIYHVDKAETPILIMHGAEDTRVAPSQSYELYRNIKVRKPDTPVRLVLYPGEGHGNSRAASRYDYNLRMMEWFDTYLKTGDRDAALPGPRPDLQIDGDSDD